jgi:hypothetical protein
MMVSPINSPIDKKPNTCVQKENMYLRFYLLTLQSYKKYNNDWRYGQQDMSPMWRPTLYNTISTI